VVDHFNKSGSGIDLDRLAQSGMSAWADSWMLFEHADGSPDIANGVFNVSTGIGSRQWGGEEWTLHLNIGPFDKESSSYLTTMKVEAHAGIVKGGSPSATDAEINRSILDFIEANPDQTKNEIIDGVMGECWAGRRRVTGQFEGLVSDGRIKNARRPHKEGNRSPSRLVWDVAPTKIVRPTRPGPGRVAPNSTHQLNRRARAKAG